VEGIGSMITESGPSWSSEDDTPTQVFGAIQDFDDPPVGSTVPGSLSGREEHGLTALLTHDPRSVIPPRTRERRTIRATALLGAVVLIVLGVATYEVIDGLGHSAKPAAATSAASSRPASSPPPSPTQSASPASSPSTVPAATSILTLHPVSATAVGPGGKTGDDPQAAQLVLSKGQTPWQTDWYTTPLFGGLQTGTGLLIDLGTTSTVDEVTLTLTPGVTFQLRAGQRPDPAATTTIATGEGTAGPVRLTLAAPTHARYLLIWITRLVPDGQGHYAAKVYHVTVKGS